MINQIGESAGQLWRYLQNHPSSQLKQAAKELKLTESMTGLAAGWLAREDKIAFEPNGRFFTLSLKR